MNCSLIAIQYESEPNWEVEITHEHIQKWMDLNTIEEYNETQVRELLTVAIGSLRDEWIGGSSEYSSWVVKFPSLHTTIWMYSNDTGLETFINDLIDADLLDEIGFVLD